MNYDPDSRVLAETEPPPITPEEFDAKFDAGEDISRYIDWSSATNVRPGALSPGRKESLLTMFKELTADEQSKLMRALLGGVSDKVNREVIVQSLVDWHLEEQKAAR